MGRPGPGPGCQPQCEPVCQPECNRGGGYGFSFIVVLFILLVIVGACYAGNNNTASYGCAYPSYGYGGCC